MRNLFLLIFILLITSCNKNDTDDQSINLTGNWVSEQKDTLTFVGSRMLIYKNYNPYFTVLYDYQQKNDSILLILAHSSNLNDRKSYYFKYYTEQLELYRFNNIERTTYQRLRSK